eukprot:EG_transcript_8955
MESGDSGGGFSKLQADFHRISSGTPPAASCSQRLGACTSIIAALQALPSSPSVERCALLRDALQLKKALLDDVLADNLKDLTNSTLSTLQSLKADERALRDRLEENQRLQAALQDEFDRKATQWSDRNEAAKSSAETDLQRVIQEILSIQQAEALQRQARWTINSHRLQTATLQELCWMPGEQLRALAEQARVDLGAVAEKSDMVQGIVETLSADRHSEMGRALGLHVELAKGPPLDLLRPYIRSGCRTLPPPPTFPEGAVPIVSGATDRSVLLAWPPPRDVSPHSRLQFKVFAKLLYPLDHPSADFAPHWREVLEAIEECRESDVQRRVDHLIPGASYVFRVECVTVHATPAATGASPRVTLRSEFQPTDEWLEVLPDIHGRPQPVPSGCQFRSDLESGRTLARRWH